MAKVRACLQALQFTENLGFRRIFVEGDALTVIRKMKSTKEDKSVIGMVIRASKDKVETFEEIEFCYIPWEVNAAAHGLAQEGKWFESAKYWIEDAPLRVEELAQRTDDYCN
ncbi:hypothetical protein Gogos_020069 [Gossypium gossypioides]|uniref:RNase H type-1 domain-containing protein n=1 Tax=Gossypium gossypioides TaxID=34282 RepID=A0A7J9D3L4_GOSGO|nr:hypothetical protein [Gossypium gossypioides]